MAIPNFTEDGKQKKAEQLLGCSAAVTGAIRDELVFLLVCNIFLCITALLGNTLILASLHKVSSLHPPTKLLLRNLAISDLLVGLISEPLAIVFWVSSMTERWNICRYTFFSGLVIGCSLCGVSLFTVTAMSVDKLLALSLGLRYRQIITLKRASAVVVMFWVVCFALSAMYMWDELIAIRSNYIFITLCLITSIFTYTKIFFGLRHRHNQVQDLANKGQTSGLNIARYKRAVFSALWLYMVLVICYFPQAIVSGLSIHIGLSPAISRARQFSGTLVFLNSTLNPLLYFWKLREVRQAAKDTTKRLFCASN